MQRLTYKILLFIFLSTLSLITTYAAVLEEKTIYNFDQNWLKYDKYYEAYLPIQDKDLKNQKSLHQIINIEEYRNYKLKFKASKGLSFFINNKLIYKKNSQQAQSKHVNANYLH